MEGENNKCWNENKIRQTGIVSPLLKWFVEKKNENGGKLYSQKEVAIYLTKKMKKKNQ